MAEQTLKTIVKQRFDTLANWQTVWSTFVPKRGEVCVFEVPTGSNSQPVNGSVSVPQHITKTGDGTTTLENLPWDSALAADVYAWAKAATKPTYTKSEVGLGNVTNESKATMFTSPTFTGTPTAPTATAGTNTTQIATTAFVTTAVSNLASSTKVNNAKKADEATKTTNSLTLKSGSTNLEVFNGSAAGSVEFVAGSNVTLTPADGKLTIAATDTTYSAASSSTDGLMSAADKAKLDGIAEKANNYTLPNAGTALGGVKSGGVATISGGQITAISKATSATTADKVANTLTIQGNGTTAGTFNGSAAESINIKGAGSTTVTGADGVITITGATIPTALKNPNALTVGSKTYDGSSAITIAASDLGLSNALHFIGAVDSLPESGTDGDVVLLGSKEYVYSNGEWVELGDGSSHALKTVTITAGKGLTGGGDISTNRTLNVGAGTGISVTDNAVALATCGTAGTYGPTANVTGSDQATIKIPQITTDEYGRVTSITERTYTSVNTDNNTTYTAGTGLALNGTTFNHSNSVTAGTASEGGSARTLAFGGSFNIPSVTYDAQGHITGKSSIALKLPAKPTDTTYSAASGGGLKLNGTAFSIDTDTIFVLDGGSATSAW